MVSADNWVSYETYYTVVGATPWSFFFIHELEGMGIPFCFDYRKDDADSEHPLAIERCIDYYHRLNDSVDLNAVRLNDMWGHAHEPHYDEFIQALLTRNHEVVSHMLRNMGQTALGRGFINGVDPANAQALTNEQLWVVDKLLSLANALGWPIMCPEQGNQSLAGVDLNEVLQFISASVPIAPPKAGGGTYGLRVPTGVISQRDVISMYIATRVECALEGKDKSVCEIGGGSGTLSYYMAQRGMRVSLFDLPIVSLLQSYFLMTSLGTDQVWIFGEESRPTAPVRVHPWWELSNAADDEFSGVVNVDSLPEIERTVAENYVRLIHAKAKHAFVSVNQEARAINTGTETCQSVVSDLIAQHGGFKRTLRVPFWIRAGYVEEIFSILK